ncbi:hypothetical protein XA68_11070 [Ophiocordyceps unilateralis]|uniref:Uncharacterized protein n=1 Tax=Ophiocordyceps unilateralis TaxID=268505 RepID=A0A2A9PGA2_OPHUN|nr:hypothetical protein XA68_11070 [Ophiocordyceps unilateralis]
MAGQDVLPSPDTTPTAPSRMETNKPTRPLTRQRAKLARTMATMNGVGEDSKTAESLPKDTEGISDDGVAQMMCRCMRPRIIIHTPESRRRERERMMSGGSGPSGRRIKIKINSEASNSGHEASGRPTLAVAGL